MDSLVSSASNYVPVYSGIEQRLQKDLYQPQKQSIITFLDDDGSEGYVGALHSPWGEWLAWWDAIDAMENRLESEDVTRRMFAPEDILYYAHYIPSRGHKDDLFDSADMRFSYEDYDEVEYFGSVDAENDEEISLSYISMTPEMLEEEKEEQITLDEPQTAENEAEELHGQEINEKIEIPEMEEIISMLLLQTENR